MNLEEIKTKSWQPSIDTQGAIVQDWEDIHQGLIILLMTQKGSDPLRPLFGVDLLSKIDQPITRAVPKLIAEIQDAVDLWEPRATITKITHQVNDGTVTVKMTWNSQTTENQITEISYELK